jgi:hypothetical protein
LYEKHWCLGNGGDGGVRSKWTNVVGLD